VGRGRGGGLKPDFDEEGNGSTLLPITVIPPPIEAQIDFDQSSSSLCTSRPDLANASTAALAVFFNNFTR
jgi:hypothetical protein